jgi:plastocyanin
VKTKSLLARLGSICLLLVLGACGGGSEDTSFRFQPGAAYSPTTTPLGNFNVKCGQTPAQQVQQKIPYQQQQQQSGPSCSPQFEFYSAVATDFDVNLDCRNGRVLVTSKGLDQSSIAIPIQQDGSWNGQLAVDQSVQNDGQGNVFCKVRTIVNFNGSASCASGDEGLTWGTTVKFAPSSASGSAAGSAALLALEASLPAVQPTSSPTGSPTDSAGVVADPEDPQPVELTPTPAGTVAAGIASPTPSASPAASPSASPTACTFSNPENVRSRTLEISIPQGAADLGCSAYGAGAYNIAAGTRVTWTNEDTHPHTVTSDDGSADTFDSGTLLPGQSYTHVFNKVGSFTYHSSLDANMQGQMTVQQVSTPLPEVSPTATPTPTISVPPIVIPPVEPTATPTVTPPVTVTPSPSPSPSISPSPSPSPSVSPGTTPSPSATQIVSCVVVNPCPIFAQTSQKCPLPAQQ